MYNNKGQWVDARFPNGWKEHAVKNMNPEQIANIAFIHGRKNVETEGRLNKLISELSKEKSKLEETKHTQVTMYTNDASNTLQKIINILNEVLEIDITKLESKE